VRKWLVINSHKYCFKNDKIHPAMPNYNSTRISEGAFFVNNENNPFEISSGISEDLKNIKKVIISLAGEWRTT